MKKSGDVDELLFYCVCLGFLTAMADVYLIGGAGMKPSNPAVLVLATIMLLSFFIGGMRIAHVLYMNSRAISAIQRRLDHFTQRPGD